MAEQHPDFIGGGWKTLNEVEVDTAKAQADMEADIERRALERYDEDKAFHTTFRQGAGAKVLKVLRDMTIEQPCFFPAAHPLAGGHIGEMSAAEQGMIREGQNSIVREIEIRMRRAEEGPPELRAKEGT